MLKHAKKLTSKQEQFCSLYTDKNGECFWNATLSYLKAYNVWYNTANTSWSRMTENVSISYRIDQLLKYWDNNLNIDTELHRTILQNENLWAKISAIKLYYRMTWRFKIKKEDKCDDKSVEWFNWILASQIEKNRICSKNT